MTSIIRAVTESQRTVIQDFGGFHARANSYDGKLLFATTSEDAPRYGQITYRLSVEPSSVVDAMVPRLIRSQVYAEIADNRHHLQVGED